MRAIQFSTYGAPDVLHLADVPEPRPGAGQLRITVRTVGVNPYDCKVRSGVMARGSALAAPVVPGLEAAGVVDRLGDGVTGVALGDEVFGLGAATYAELAVLRAWAPKPAGIGFEQAAALAVAGETASRMLTELAPQPGRTVLVHGAAGGVGQAAVQLARVAGLRVIGTASAGNHDWLRALGAEPVTYGEGLPARVAALVPAGVDAVLDTAGSQLDDLLALVASPDRVVTIANYTAAERGVRFTGGGGDAAAALARIAELAGSGRFAIRVAGAFPLAEASAAHELSESRRSAGKVVLSVS